MANGKLLRLNRGYLFLYQTDKKQDKQKTSYWFDNIA